MKMRNLFLTVCMSLFFTQLVVAVPDVSMQDRYPFGTNTSGMIVQGFIDLLKNKEFAITAITIAGLYSLSIIQKENPDFVAAIVRTLEWPFFIIERKMQHFYCGGKSLTWNEVASWHNRVSRILTPLTKTTSVIDLSKDRRLRSMDQEDDVTGHQDTQWLNQVAHIEKEFLFLKKVLMYRLRYYKDVPSSKKKKSSIVKSFGKNVVRTSLNRNEEIAFGLEEAIVYLNETIVYCKSVSQFSSLDKEHLKRLVGNICTVFEHLGVLVDEVTAADRNKKKIPMSADGALNRAYTGAAGIGYSDSYTSSGSYGSY